MSHSLFALPAKTAPFKGFSGPPIFVLFFFLLQLAWVSPVAAAPPVKIVLSVPGPLNISFLPVDFIHKIGADKAEGAELQIVNVGGGAAALKQLNSRNSDFAMLGMPAIMFQKASSGDVIAVAPVNDSPLWVLMVRAELRDKVRSIADLKGRTIGVTTSTPTSKTVTQQLLDLLLASAGVASDEVRYLSIGKNWEEQSAAILSGSVDAIMADEPFASRLESDGKIFVLANPAIPKLAPTMPDSGFLHGTLATRSDVIASQPETVATMVRILRRTLAWMSKHTPAELVNRLDIADPQEKASLLACLDKYKGLYSSDARFSNSQLKKTETFFRATNPDPKAQTLAIESVVNDHWAGNKP